MGVAGWVEFRYVAHKLRDFRIKTKHTHTRNHTVGLPSACRVSSKSTSHISSTIFSFDLNASINSNTFGAKKQKSFGTNNKRPVDFFLSCVLCHLSDFGSYSFPFCVLINGLVLKSTPAPARLIYESIFLAWAISKFLSFCLWLRMSRAQPIARCASPEQFERADSDKQKVSFLPANWRIRLK